MASPLRRIPLYEQAYESVRDLLRDGSLRSGEAVSELRLADMLGMSRTPVREALRRLVAEHILEAVPGGGLRVPLPTPDDVAEVYVTRAALEAEAARVATTVGRQEFFDKLEALYTQMQGAADAGDVALAIESNGAFHSSIVEFAGNKRIIALLKSFEDLAVRYRSYSLTVPEHLRQSLHDHRQLIDVIRSGKADVAAEFSRNHILRAGGRVVRILRSLEGAQAAPSPTAKLLLSKIEGTL